MQTPFCPLQSCAAAAFAPPTSNATAIMHATTAAWYRIGLIPQFAAASGTSPPR